MNTHLLGNDPVPPETRFNNLSIRIKNIKLIEWTSIAFLSAAFLLNSAGFSCLLFLLKVVYASFGYNNYVFILLILFSLGNIVGSFSGHRMVDKFKSYRASLAFSAFLLSLFSITVYMNLSFILGEYSEKLDFLWLSLPILGSFAGGLGSSMLWILHSHYLSLCITPFNDYFLTKIFWSIYSFYHLIGFIICYFFCTDVDFFKFLEILASLQLLSIIMFLLTKEPDLKIREETYKI